MGFNIGDIEIKNRIVLAPMAGVSNPAFFKICEDMGVGLVITELISSEAVSRNNKKTLDMLNGLDKINIPTAIQLFGSNPETIAEAAKVINNIYPKCIIDLNFGCPVPKVAIKAKAGSALLKEPDKIKKIVNAVSKAVDVPVTVKIRSGWDENSINAVEIAKICEEAGAKAIAIHARTRSAGYSGKANWNIIKEVKKHVNIPVIGNGDVTTPELAKKMLDETSCDAVMVGRGAMGNPWLLKQSIEYIESGEIKSIPSVLDRIEMIKKHFSFLLETKTEKVALLEIRGHAAWYIKGLKDSSKIRESIMKVQTKEELYKLLENYKITCF